MVGPPGAGKMLLRHDVPGIVPRMTIDEAQGVARLFLKLEG
jgi:predicted ATPase with chaperone activity